MNIERVPKSKNCKDYVQAELVLIRDGSLADKSAEEVTKEINAVSNVIRTVENVIMKASKLGYPLKKAED